MRDMFESLTKKLGSGVITSCNDIFSGDYNIIDNIDDELAKRFRDSICHNLEYGICFSLVSIATKE